MAFPQSPLDIKVELNYGSAWNDITTYVRGTSDIVINRGRTDSTYPLDPSSCTLTLDNRDGRFSNRNPASPLYGKAGRNTPIRVSIPATTKYLRMPGDPAAAAASCPDASGLDITGDIDIRFDADMNWRGQYWLCGKYAASTNQRSYALTVNAFGFLQLGWSTDGTSANLRSATSTAALPVTQGRLAVRAVLDVNNGSSGNTATFYTADTLSGSWTQLGSTVTASGTTSIFSSSATFEVGGGSDFNNTSTHNPRGRLYGVQVLSGIAGTAKANPDFTSQTVGASSFNDTVASPNTFTLASNVGRSEVAAISDRDYRFTGEVSSWPQSWDPTGSDVYVEVTANGLLRRLRQNEQPLHSAMYRACTADPKVVAYWPMEEADGAAYLASPIAGCGPMTFTRGATNKPDLHSYGGFGGSDSVPAFQDTYFSAEVPVYKNNTSTGSLVRFLFYTPAETSMQRIITVRTTGTAREWRLFYNSSGNISIYCYDEDGTQILTGGLDAADLDNRPVQIGFALTASGSDTAYVLYVGDATSGDWGSWTATLTGYTPGVVSHVDFNPGGGLGDSSNAAALGHVAVLKNFATSDLDFDTLAFSAPPHGWRSEPAGDRFNRLCDEQSIGSYVIGSAAQCLSMNNQRPDALSNLLAECVDADLGLLIEPRDAAILAMRARNTMVNQSAALTLSYSSGELSDALPASEDDSLTANSVTVTSTGGSSASAEQTTGLMSTQAFPDGVGNYPLAVEKNLELGEILPSQAFWALRLGTLDAPRYPEVTVDLARSETSALANDALAVDLGDKLVITDLPSWLPPDDAVLRVEGYTETLNAFTHTLNYHCSPGDPYEFAVVGTDRYDSDDTYLRTAASSTDTSLETVVRKGPLWGYSTNYGINVGGEKMTVTAVSGSAAYGLDVRDTFTAVSSSTWDPATTGQNWSSAGGNNSFSKNGSYGTFNVTLVNSAQYAQLLQNHTDIDFKFRYALEKVPTGANALVSALARYTATNNFYEARTVISTSGAVTLSIEKNVSGSFSTVASSTSTGITLAAGSYLWIRFRLQGTSLMAKVWADGTDEPASWTRSGTDSSLTSGTSLTVRAFLFTGYTAGTPAKFYLKDLDAAVPQTMTVTRSVNGVVKSQSADQQLTLYNRPHRNYDMQERQTGLTFDWYTGEVLGSLRSPRTVQASDGTNISNIASTTPSVGTPPEVGVRFLAPLTGRVLITVGGAARDNTNSNRAYLSLDMWKAKADDNTWANVVDGTVNSPVVNAWRYGWMSSGQSTEVESGSNTYLYSGLVPGMVYYARIMHSADITTSASADIMYRQITVEPAT